MAQPWQKLRSLWVIQAIFLATLISFWLHAGQKCHFLKFSNWLSFNWNANPIISKFDNIVKLLLAKSVLQLFITAQHHTAVCTLMWTCFFWTAGQSDIGELCSRRIQAWYFKHKVALPFLYTVKWYGPAAANETFSPAESLEATSAHQAGKSTKGISLLMGPCHQWPLHLVQRGCPGDGCLAAVMQHNRSHGRAGSQLSRPLELQAHTGSGHVMDDHRCQCPQVVRSYVAGLCAHGHMLSTAETLIMVKVDYFRWKSNPKS